MYSGERDGLVFGKFFIKNLLLLEGYKMRLEVFLLAVLCLMVLSMPLVFIIFVKRIQEHGSFIIRDWIQPKTVLWQVYTGIKIIQTMLMLLVIVPSMLFINGMLAQSVSILIVSFYAMLLSLIAEVVFYLYSMQSKEPQNISHNTLVKYGLLTLVGATITYASYTIW